MWNDVVDFNGFYRGRLGKAARALLMAEIRTHWPSVKGLSVAGLGYATPYLKQFNGEAERVLALMPAHQGVTHWPRGGPNRCALTDETALPFDVQSIDRLLLVHAVENSEHLRALMKECWRILAPQGRMLAVVPARGGIWSRTERTPFGHGKPFSRGQMEKLLRNSFFEPLSITRALHMPPSPSEFVLRSSHGFETVGRRWFKRFGGVLVVEAHKQVYAAKPARRMAVKEAFWPVPQLQPAAAGRNTASRETQTG